jgi:hypothetical protein
LRRAASTLSQFFVAATRLCKTKSPRCVRLLEAGVALGARRGETTMRYLHIGFGCLIVSALNVVACGDDDSKTTGTGGGTSSGGASGSAGLGGTAGTGVTGGASGTSTGGTTATGGTSGTGTGGTATGGTATGGTAGTGGMGTGCPGSAPMDGAMCNADDSPDDCNYGTSVCECGGPPMGPEGTWSCSVCPTTAPTNGAACDGDMNGSPCTFGGTVCECTGGGGPGGGEGGAGADGDTWECTTCPATEPMDGSACDSDMNDECDYGMTTCDCGGDDMWDCS